MTTLMDPYLPPLVASPKALIYVLPLVVAAIWTWAKQRKVSLNEGVSPQSSRQTAISFAWLLILTTLFVAGDTVINFYLPALYHSQWLALAAIFTAIVLFYVRREVRWFYALIEIFGALLAIYVTTIPSSLPVAQRSVAIVGAVYFLIRGLDNADQGGLFTKIKQTAADIAKHRLQAALMLSMPVAFAYVVITKPSDGSAWKAPDTPVISSSYGLNEPVSALRCGEPFVKCAKKDWIERDRLLAGTQKERDAAEADAKRRFDEYFSEPAN